MSNCDPIVSVLRRFREEKKMSQEQLAKKTGMSASTISRVESCRTSMTLEQYRKYLIALDITDMDVSVALYTHEFVTEKDVAAAAKLYSAGARKIISRFLRELFYEVKKQQKGG
ncbi:helix-turn-helix domain-containing protein [Vibrio cholerae]|uniref:helix-turn-helix domain-containing protein n=1 Tax=Oceanimonas smirnovii TaxID=264574 RepID=UPI0034DA65FE|nr:XRE family transcriptional regulator [Vibrio cholerae]EJL6636775.1 helix-turn-helix transcriptional regulator [Vibrio cholerae]